MWLFGVDIRLHLPRGSNWFDFHLCESGDNKCGAVTSDNYLCHFVHLFFSQDNFGYDLPAVEAASKKHEAIETDINAYQDRVLAVVAVAEELEEEKYHDIDRINAR